MNKGAVLLAFVVGVGLALAVALAALWHLAWGFVR